MAIRQPTSPVAGVLIPMIPVADLSRSVAFYTTLLGLELRREFVQDGRVTGASLGGSDLDFGLNLRLATTLAGPTDLRGEHPVVWRVDDRAALEEFLKSRRRPRAQPSCLGARRRRDRLCGRPGRHRGVRRSSHP